MMFGERGLLTIYEIGHCTAFGPCNAHGITPSSLLVFGEQKSRQRCQTLREPRLAGDSMLYVHDMRCGLEMDLQLHLEAP